MKTKRFLLMMLVALMSATGAWATLKDVDYAILSSSPVVEGYDVNNLKDELIEVGFELKDERGTKGTVVLDAKKSICLASYTLTPPILNLFLPVSVSVEGSNNQSSWTMVKSGASDFEAGEQKIVGIDSKTSYRYYRFTFYGVGYVYLLQLRLFYYAMDGNGTASNPYKLDDYQSWQMFYEKCAANPAVCGKLTKDLNLNGRTWNPALDFEYTGTLDGDNHVISNLTSSVGLFKNTGAATIKNLIIENASLTTTDENSGVIAAQANGTTFENCIVKGSVSSNATNAGALVGNADGNTTFNQCFAATNLDNDGDAHLPVCGSGNATFNNTYYYGAGSATAVAKTDVGNGRLAYLLNNGNITGPYFQRIGTDAYPHFTKTGQNYVYLAIDDASYTNVCPHRDHTVYPFTAPSCLGTYGNTEYAKCDNSVCGRYFLLSDRNAVTTNKNNFALSSKAVKLQDHPKYENGNWRYSKSKERGGTTYYNVMDVIIPRFEDASGNYEVFYTVMDDAPTMNLHYFFNSTMTAGSFSVRFYVNGTERSVLRKDYPSSNEEQHEVVAVDGLHKYDRIKVVINYRFVVPNGTPNLAYLFVGQEKPLPASHDFRKQEIVYNCIEGGYQEHYECNVCKLIFAQNTPDSDADITTLSKLAIAPTGAHTYKVINGNLHGQECVDERCKAENPNDYVLKNYNNGTDVPLTSNDGKSYAAKTTVKLTDAKEYVAPVGFSMETLEYQRTFNTNVWNAWFVPFATTVSELADKGVTDVACIESIHNYDTDKDGVVDKTVLEVILKKNGTVKAGVPYMVKTGDDYTYPMTFTNKVMDASTDTKTVHTETGSAAYDFMGTYAGLTAGEVTAANIFSLNNDGAMVHRTGSILPQRWYMKEVQKDNVYEEILPAQARGSISILVIGEEDSLTGIRTIYTADKQTEELLPDGFFDLSGRRLSAPQRGKINIINGKKLLVK